MKSFLFLPLLLLAVTFTSCKKEEITQEVVIPNRTIRTTIQAADWQLDAAKNTYYVTVNTPEIDGTVYENDAVLAYFSFDNGKTYEAIPDVISGTTFQVTYDIGHVYVDFQNADGSLPIKLSQAVIMKIVLVESQLLPG